MDIKRGEVIETCPIIVLPEEQVSDLAKTKLFDYYFAWGKDFKVAAVCLGFGSLYNHSYKPNAKYIKDFEDSLIRFEAIKDIERDEEILVNYNGRPDDQTKIWFEVC